MEIIVVLKIVTIIVCMSRLDVLFRESALFI